MLMSAAPSPRRTARPHSGARPGTTPLRSEGVSVPGFSRPQPPGNAASAAPNRAVTAEV